MAERMTAQQHYDEAHRLLTLSEQHLFHGGVDWALASAKAAEVHVMLGDRAALLIGGGDRG
ncbi:hypothetical protein [Actinoplanes sp. N902-109]|uniref:hypothetical protein n=1 Tax=Actinoplanes sp. (strain N902-109) TaxID=649831 RepID=UPI0003294810|nr:hypothetical protein [Actinoplanes sp. N902-109]AGL20934.1 hypothetical protein L083_7424 [Actinoplanes sp. N902-109]